MANKTLGKPIGCLNFVLGELKTEVRSWTASANEDGEVHLISLVSKTILKRLRINRPILAMSFSPDGKQFALAK